MRCLLELWEIFIDRSEGGSEEIQSGEGYQNDRLSLEIQGMGLFLRFIISNIGFVVTT